MRSQDAASKCSVTRAARSSDSVRALLSSSLDSCTSAAGDPVNYVADPDIDGKVVDSVPGKEQRPIPVSSMSLAPVPLGSHPTFVFIVLRNKTTLSLLTTSDLTPTKINHSISFLFF